MKAARSTAATGKSEREDEGTVVGAMVSGSHVHVEQASSVGGVKAVPAVRALAKKLKVDLTRVQPSGADGVVTMQDVKNAAANGSAALGARTGPQQRAGLRRSSSRPAAAGTGSPAHRHLSAPASRCAPLPRACRPAASRNSSRACVATWRA